MKAFTIGLWASLVVAVAFLGIPLAALFLRVPPGELVSQLGSETAREALWVTVRANLVAQALVVLVGTPAAYLLATRRFRGRDLVISVLELPLVLPPAVAGVALLAAFGRSGLFGGQLEALGVTIPFTEAAVVIAVCFVSSPFFVRAAITGFESVDPQLVDAARTLGARAPRVFARISLPLAASSLGAGATLAFARGLGEFGATIMFTGSLPGVTQTMPLAIYAALGQDFDVALALGGLLVLVSIAILLVTKALPRWARSLSPSTSTSRSARSLSS